ncbi:lipase family protein [Actinomadura keratinilytica]|uniref:Lipase family protein n=1 Tax=Actinomadura keratinilytica TaxID=547461 RepID=A0ABP7YE62_9ACTN
MRVRVVAASAVTGAALTLASVGAAQPASAAPSQCLASEADIYAAAPASIDGDPGDLLACRQVTLPGVGGVRAKAWKVRYVTTDVKDAKTVATGFVAVPEAAWTKSGSRPVVAFHPGTSGLGPQCAFSKQMTGAYVDHYEGPNVAEFLKAGFAVAAADGPGYIDGKVHTYMVGQSAGKAVLDIARTSRQIPGGSLRSDGKVGIAGYSEGGQAALWAAQLAASYAPELQVAGAAAGGVPGDLKVTAERLNGGLFAGFAADALVGHNAAYPDMPFDELMNDKGAKAVQDAKRLCLFGTLGRFLGARVENLTKDKLTLDQIWQLRGPDGTWGELADRSKLGVDIGAPGSSATYQIGFPVFQYRGALEEIIPTETEDATRAAYCKAGINTTWNKSYVGEHLLTDWLAAGDVTRFLNDRFEGKPVTGNC